MGARVRAVSVIEIRRLTVAELDAAPELPALVDEHAAESAMPELGTPAPQRATYYALEKAGVLFPLGAFDGDRLVGFALPIVAPPPHYGVLAGTLESFFVAAADRKGGAGLALLAAAEDLARERGARALLVVAPVGSVLDAVLAERPYRHSNNVHVRALT